MKKYLSILLISCTILSLGIPHLAYAAEATIDTTTSTTVGRHRINPALVFISDQVGYMFYIDSNGQCGYRKTTDGGANWNGFQATTAQTDCMTIGIWYDQWTPGDSGTVIHIVFNESGTDDVFYDTLDTNGDSHGTEADIRQPSGALTQADPVSITKGTDGTLYIASEDGTTAQAVHKCSTTCDDPGNWSATSAFTTDTPDDAIRLMPLSGGNILLIRDDISAEDIQSKVYVPGTDTWDSSFDTLDANAADSTTYQDTIAPTIDTATGDIYLAYGASVAGAGTADIRTAVYSGGSWTLKTDVITNQNTVTNMSIAIDQNTGDIYVGYLRGTLTTDMNAYFVVSTDGMTSWSGETQFNSTGVDLRWMHLNMMSNERIYGVYEQNATNDGLFGNTIADLTPGGGVSAPTVTTDSAQSFTTTSGTLFGTITDTGGETGGSTQHGLAYSTNSALSTGVSTTTEGTYAGTGAFSSSLSGLAANTTYYYRAYATNSGGTGYGTIKSFATGDSTPARLFRLFEGFSLKILNGFKMILYGI